MRPLCVVGLGLIGGSVLRAALASGMAGFGHTASDADATAARAEGFDVATDLAGALRMAAAQDALVCLAVPLTEVDAVLRVVAECAPEVRLTDVVGVKAPVLDAVRRLAPRTRYVGGHPMAGTAESGWAAGSAKLFVEATWVVCAEEDTPLGAWRDVAELALACGARVVPTTADEHDSAVARISHLPHLFAAVLASVGADRGPLPLALAAGSFTDATRVAATRPELVTAMCEGNGAALLPVLDDALGRLGAARGALASTGTVAATVHSGHAGRADLDAARRHRGARVRIDLTADGAHEALRGLGEQGGSVVALDAAVAVAEL